MFYLLNLLQYSFGFGWCFSVFLYVFYITFTLFYFLYTISYHILYYFLFLFLLAHFQSLFLKRSLFLPLRHFFILFVCFTFIFIAAIARSGTLFYRRFDLHLLLLFVIILIFFFSLFLQNSTFLFLILHTHDSVSQYLNILIL